MTSRILSPRRLCNTQFLQDRIGNSEKLVRTCKNFRQDLWHSRLNHATLRPACVYVNPFSKARVNCLSIAQLIRSLVAVKQTGA